MSDSERYTGGHTMPPYPVMHGSMYVEVESLDICYRTLCADCAYQLHVIADTLPISKANCLHKTMLFFSESAASGKDRILMNSAVGKCGTVEAIDINSTYIITFSNRRLWPFITLGNKIKQAITHPRALLKDILIILVWMDIFLVALMWLEV